jgi:hypothetical protein
MDMIFDPHGLVKRMEAELRKISLLSEPNKSLILDFLRNYRYKKKSLSLARRCRLASQFHFFAKLFNKKAKKKNSVPHNPKKICLQNLP